MAQTEKTLKTRMRRYLRRFMATTRRLRPPLFLVPTLTVIVGIAVSSYVYTFIRHQEQDALNQESSLRAREMINQIDLLISNSLLRIQSYEEYMGPRELRSLSEALFYKQALQYTIFSRLAIFQKVKAPGPGKKPPVLKRLHLVDSVADNLPVTPSEVAVSDELTATLQQMITQNFYQRAVIFNFGKVPVISVIMNSKFSKNYFFVYSTPLDRMFESISLRPDEEIKLTDPTSGLAWVVTMTDEKLPNGKSVARVAAARPQAPIPSGLNAYPVKYDQGLPQSGLQVNFEFRFAGADSSFAASIIIGLFTLLLTFVVAYLFWILITQNRMVSRLVVEKTHDLERAHHDVQDALQTKTRFIGNISHEIRTPLNLLLGMIDLCEERADDPKLRDYLRSMKSSGNHLLEMIEDLLDLAKSESNEIHMQEKVFALTPFLEEVGRFAGQECAKKSLTFGLDLPAESLPSVKCDPIRLRQVLLNLLKNACKYTNEGYVRLKVSAHDGTTPDRRRFVFEIEDSGIGIPKDKAAKIFDAFFQVESGRILSEGGVGLGLSIVKELVQRMNGTIDVRSDAGRGSVFRVELELETPDAAALKKSRRTEGAAPPGASGQERVRAVVGQNLSILAADDDDGNRELLRAYFEGTSWQVDYAVNGQDAWERYLHHKSDVLILDVRMPVLDGFSVVDKIRAHEKQTNAVPTPIILVTADALAQTADRAKGYEALSYLTKPVRKSKLFETIAQTREF